MYLQTYFGEKAIGSDRGSGTLPSSDSKRLQFANAKAETLLILFSIDLSAGKTNTEQKQSKPSGVFPIGADVRSGSWHLTLPRAPKIHFRGLSEQCQSNFELYWTPYYRLKRQFETDRLGPVSSGS